MIRLSSLTIVYERLAIRAGPLRDPEARLRGKSDGWKRRSAKERPSIGRRCDNALMAARPDFAERRQRIVKGAALVVSLVVSAGLMVAAIGSLDYSWARWISLLPLLVCIRILGPIRAMGCGALWEQQSLSVLSDSP